MPETGSTVNLDRALTQLAQAATRRVRITCLVDRTFLAYFVSVFLTYLTTILMLSSTLLPLKALTGCFNPDA